MTAVSTLVGDARRSVEDATRLRRAARVASAARDPRPVATASEPHAALPQVATASTGLGPRRSEPSTPAQQELDRLHRALSVRRYPSLALHWFRRWFRRPHAVRPDPLAPVRRGEVAVTFVGHASVLLRYHDLAVAFDPMLGNWVGGVRRAVSPGLTAGDFRDVGLILISHRHLDHLHLPTLRAMPKRATIVVPAGAAAVVSPLGFDRVVELRPGSDFEFRGLKIATASLQHGEGELAEGLCYVVRGRGPSLFLCGDTAYHAGFAKIGERFALDVALLPIGGFWPRSFRQRHMSPLDALAAFKDLSARALVPIHHGAFPLSYERLEEPMRILLEVAALRGVRDYIVAMEPGQTDTFALESGEQALAERGSAPDLAMRDE
jgi:L-ascorbate metabolism protein UlaG (beta-lactamase superfamily)